MLSEFDRVLPLLDQTRESTPYISAAERAVATLNENLKDLDLQIASDSTVQIQENIYSEVESVSSLLSMVLTHYNTSQVAAIAGFNEKYAGRERRSCHSCDFDRRHGYLVCLPQLSFAEVCNTDSAAPIRGYDKKKLRKGS